jgi:hypothetical protein
MDCKVCTPGRDAAVQCNPSVRSTILLHNGENPPPPETTPAHRTSFLNTHDLSSIPLTAGVSSGKMVFAGAG